MLVQHQYVTRLFDTCRFQVWYVNYAPCMIYLSVGCSIQKRFGLVWKWRGMRIFSALRRESNYVMWNDVQSWRFGAVSLNKLFNTQSNFGDLRRYNTRVLTLLWFCHITIHNKIRFSFITNRCQWSTTVRFITMHQTKIACKQWILYQLLLNKQGPLWVLDQYGFQPLSIMAIHHREW